MLLAIVGIGVWLLRRAWRREGPRAAQIWGGWLLLLGALIAGGVLLGPVRGVFIALTVLSVVAWSIVSSGLELREARAPRTRKRTQDGLAPEPLERPSVWWQTTLRWLLAGPVGMIAAMAVGICYAVWVPGFPQTRLLIAGLMVPVLWGGAMAWTLCDNRVLRATAVLVGTSVVGFGAAILRGFA